MKVESNKGSRERILAVATKLFAEKGFEATSVREICQQAKINLCMISHYWGSKQGLYQGIVDQIIEDQIEFAKQFVKLDENFATLSLTDQIRLLKKVLNKFVDFFYTHYSKDLLKILLVEQQSEYFVKRSPALRYFYALVSSVFKCNASENEIIFIAFSLISIVIGPKIWPTFSFKMNANGTFSNSDIQWIKSNVQLYFNALLKSKNMEILTV